MTAKPRILVRFVDEHGIPWTIWDASFSKHKHHRKAHGDEAASSRIFVNAAGVRRSYTFKRGERRELDEAALDRQLREAEYLGAGKPFDPKTHGPR